MKNIISILICAMLLISLFSCSGNDRQETPGTELTSSSSADDTDPKNEGTDAEMTDNVSDISLTVQPEDGSGTLTDSETGAEYSSSVLIISFADETDDDEYARFLEDYGFTTVYRYSSLNMCAVSFEPVDADGMKALIDTLMQDARVAGAEPDYIIRLDDPVEGIADTPSVQDATAPAEGSVEFRSVTAYANWTDETPVMEKCLNGDKMIISSERHLPVFRLGSEADLEDFITEFGGILTMDRGYDEIPSFRDATAGYDSAFFSDHTLLLAYVTSGSGTYRYDVSGVHTDGSAVCMDVVMTNDPEVVTCDMAGWFIMAEVNDSDIENCTGTDSVFRGLSAGAGFRFSLTWNCYGVSSYDSSTGRLVKTTDATNPDDYVTTYAITEQNRKSIFDIITALDPASYPDIYDPNVNVKSYPPMTLILTVKTGGTEKTIRAENIAMSFTSDDADGQRFLDACRYIISILTATDEWNALPEYEVLYD